ncbi:MAG TPA: PAS domain S-box protein [Streptosporangiaceae bacterium]|nr:PAS domain S-box protein [Streptosporangiaceae bacterium]
MKIKGGLRWRIIGVAGSASALAAGALIIALVAAAGTHSDSQLLSRRLVPAAAAANSLLNHYSAEQAGLRAYVTSGRSGGPLPLSQAGRQEGDEQAQLRMLVRGYPAAEARLNQTVAAHQAWLARVAAPELAAMKRGDVTAAQSLQANTSFVRPLVLAIRSAGAELQASITDVQQQVTQRLATGQNVLIGALIAMCVVIALIAVDAVLAVWFGLLRPFKALRTAVDAVAAGDYSTQIPVVGPAELKDVGRSTELMRMRLVATLAEREQAEFRFRQLFDGAPDAMLAVEWDGSVTMANTRAVRMFGYRAGELIGRAVEALVPEDVRPVMEQERIKYFADPEARPLRPGLKIPGLRRDGSTFPAEITLSAMLTERGQLVTAAIRDVSERLAMEAERERLRAEAERERTERRAHQTQRLESLGQLVGGVAHDFNNLLNVIQGYTDFTAQEIQPMAESDPKLAPVLDDIEQVRVAAQQAARLTRQLLTFARHEVTRPVVLDLNEAVQGAGQLLRRTLGEHINLALNPEPALWPVRADRGQLEQVLVNLAVNARDAMPGGGRLTIDTGNVDVDETYAAGRPGLQRGRYVRLRVSDTGVGMDRATLDRVFEPFFSTKPKGRGTGLGLATVYGIITGAGGTIDVYSEPNLGTAISVLLPACTDPAAVTEAAGPAVGDGPASPEGRGEQVLLVEDEPSLRELTSRILTRHGYRVQAAATGSGAIDWARAPGHPVDLLLTDVVMPEMMGNEVAAAIRAIVPGVPALYMSGYAQPILDSHGVPALSIDILEKPFTEASLLARVRQAIDEGLPGAVGPGPAEPASVEPASAELAGDEGNGEVAFRPVTG